MVAAFSAPLLFPSIAASPPRCRVHLPRACLETKLYELPTGTTMEVITAAAAPAANADDKPPLLLVPGSFHAAWCWGNFQRHLAARGYTSHAISLRGSGRSTTGTSGKSVTLVEHLADMAAVSEALELLAPVVCGHSTGGLLVQQWAASLPPDARAVLLASKPPTDHNGLTWRIMREHGVGFFWRVFTGFVARTIATDVSVCRDVLFSRKDAPGFDAACEGDDKLREYMHYFNAQSKLPTDLKSTQVPVSDPGALRGRTLVVHAEDDRIVDITASRQTAELFEAEVQIVPGPHDLMLASHWRKAADAVLEWLDRRCEPSASVPLTSNERA